MHLFIFFDIIMTILTISIRKVFLSNILTENCIIIHNTWLPPHIISLSTLIFNWNLVAYVKMLPEYILLVRPHTIFIYFFYLFFIEYRKKEKKRKQCRLSRLFDWSPFQFWHFFFTLLFMWCNLMYLRNEFIRYSMMAYIVTIVGIL